MGIDDAKRAMTYVMQKEAATLLPSVQGQQHDMAIPDPVTPRPAYPADAV